MKIVQSNVLSSLRGVRDFLDAHADMFPSLVGSGTRKRLDDRIAELTAYVETQDGSLRASKGATQKQYALRETLLKVHMAPIARIAAGDLPKTPELAALTMPRGTPNTEVLYAAAMGMASAAEPFASVFTAAALPADFIAQLRAAAAAILVPVDARTASRGTGKGATKGVGAALLDARKAVRIIDSIVRPIIGDNAGLLDDWDKVRRPNTKAVRSTAAPALPPSPIPGTATALPAPATPALAAPSEPAAPPAS